MRASVGARLVGCLLLAGACTSSTDPPACASVAEASEAVTVTAPRGSLGGTLAVPAGCTGMPVVLIFSGSGPEDRDGNPPGGSYQTDMYKLLAIGLHDAGFATLRYDDVGVGASASALPADVSMFTYDMEVEAAATWIPTLRHDPRFGALVLAGHSQGALTAILLAERGGVDAVVSMEGEGRPLDVLLREQLSATLSPAQLMTAERVLAELKAGELAGPQQPPLDQIFAEVVQRFLISLFQYDPAAELAKVHVPALIVQGRTDVQVSVEDAQRLAMAKPDAELVLIDDLCHTLKPAAEKDLATQTAQYSDPSIPVHPALIADIAAFLRTLPRPGG